MGIYGGTCFIIYPNKVTTAQNRINKVKGNLVDMSLHTNFKRSFKIV